MENDHIPELEQETKNEEGQDEQSSDAKEQYESQIKELRAELAKMKRIAERKARQAERTVEDSDDSDIEERPSKSKPTDLDYGQKAYLAAMLNIKGKEELALVREYVAMGKSVDDLVDNRHFQNDLNDLREAKRVAEATPSGSKRGNASTRDTVDYWLAKGEMPPADQPELRRAYVNAKMKKETDGNRFSSNPTGGIILG